MIIELKQIPSVANAWFLPERILSLFIRLLLYKCVHIGAVCFKVQCFQNELKRLYVQNEKLAEEKKCLKQKLSEKTRAHAEAKVEVNNLKKQAKKYRFNLKKTKAKAKDEAKPLSKKLKDQILSDALAPYFTNAQIGCFQRQTWQRVRNWGKEDFKLALTIKMLGRGCYDYLRQLKVLPMPGKSTLSNHFRHFTISPGFLESVAQLVKYKVPFMTSEAKVCAITFDEMHLTKSIGKMTRV